MFNRIMVLTDLSDTIRFAFRPLAHLAKPGSQVFLYHAATGASDSFYLPQRMRDPIDIAARRRALARMALPRRELSVPGVEVEAIVEVGDAHSLVPEAIKRLDIDLVIIPTRAHHSLTARISNSMTARALRSQAAPVLVINERFAEREEAWHGFQHLLHPVAFGARHRHGVVAAQSVATALGANLHLVHALRSLQLDEFYSDACEELGMKIRQDTHRTHAQARLLKLIDSTLDGGARGDVIEVEDIATGLCDYARATQMGAIVLPGVGEDRVRTIILGSVAERVIKHAPCPVFICDRPIAQAEEAVERTPASSQHRAAKLTLTGPADKFSNAGR